MSKIVINDLHKYYNKNRRNEVHVINGTSLEFDNSGLVCILGESGSGKTTLLNVLSGIDNYDSGEIIIDGKKVIPGSREAEVLRREQFGYVFQNYYMIPDETVYDNLYLALAPYKLSSEEIESRIDYVLDAVDMLKYKKRNVNNLSGGQAQRIAIARALVKSPEVIFADEPTGNLDETTTLKIMSIIKKISEKCLVILATHEKRIATFFGDRMIEVSDGKVVSDKVIKSSGKTYDSTDDHTIYLGEYKKSTVKDENTRVDVYSRFDEKIDFSVVSENGRYYILSDEADKFEPVNSQSSIVVKEGVKEVIDNKTIEEFNYKLDKLNHRNTGDISGRDTKSRIFASTRTKSYVVMIIAMILISVLCTVGVGDFLTLYRDNVKDYVNTDSRVLKLDFVNRSEESDKITKEQQMKKLVEYLDFEDSMLMPWKFIPCYTKYNGFTQIENTVGTKTTAINGFSFIPLEFLDESDLVYGRMPQYFNEIVVDEWVVEEYMKNDTLVSHSISDPKGMIGMVITTSVRGGTDLYVCGISRARNKSVYASGRTIVRISGIGRSLPPDGYPIEPVIKEVVVENGNCEIIIKNPQLVYDFVNEFETKEEFEEIRKQIKINIRDEYKEKADVYYKDRDNKLYSRSIIIMCIIAVCLAALFIAMKSHANENMIYTMVYRLLGIKKIHIIKMFAIELAVASLSVSIPVSLITVGLLKFIEALPGVGFTFVFTLLAFVITNLAISLISVFVGIIPCMLILRKMPAQLVTEYDI